MIPAFYFLGLAILFAMINVKTFTKPIAKWLTYQLIWLSVLASLICTLYYFWTGESV